MNYLYLLVLLLLSACAKEPKGGPPKEAHLVEVSQVVYQDIPIYIETIGNVFAYSEVNIRPQVEGIIEEAYVQAGDFVQAGTPLYKIDPDPFQAELDRAEAELIKDQAELKFAETRLDRYSQLVEKEYISRIAFEEYQRDVELARAQILVDQAAIEKAKIDLGHTLLVSPINGKIGEFNIDVGNLVVANDPEAITEIRQLSPIKVRFSIPQKDFQQIQRMKSLNNLTFEALLPYEDGRSYSGIVNFIDNQIDRQTGTILMRGVIQNENYQLWPGEFVRVRIFLSTEKNAMMVPEQAIQSGQQGDFVFIVNQNEKIAKKIPITKGGRFNGLIQIDGNIQIGDLVVTNGQLNLSDGMEVKIVEQKEAEAVTDEPL